MVSSWRWLRRTVLGKDKRQATLLPTPWRKDQTAFAVGRLIGGRWLYHMMADRLLYGSTDRNLNHIQRAQNILACIVIQTPRSASTTGLRQQLHWLPIRQQIIFKLATVTFKAKNLR